MRIFSNTAIGLDGRISTTEGGYIQLGSVHDHRLMSKLRAEADAVMVGGGTYRNGPHPLIPSSPDPSRRWWNVIVSRTLDLPLPAELVEHPQVRVLILTRHQPIPSHIPANVEVERFDGVGDPTVDWMVSCLARRDISTLLVEAGGELLFQFVAADALDEIFVTLCPVLIGGHHTPSLMGGRGFSLQEMRRLTLLSSNVIDNEIYLHYRVNRAEKTAKN